VERTRALLSNVAQLSWAEWAQEIVPAGLVDLHLHQLEVEWAIEEERSAQAERDAEERVQAQQDAERLRMEQEVAAAAAAAAEVAQVAEAQQLAGSQQEDAGMAASGDESSDSDYRYSGSETDSSVSSDEVHHDGGDGSDGEASTSDGGSSTASKRRAEDEPEDDEERPRQIKRMRTDTATAPPKAQMKKKGVAKVKESDKPARLASRHSSVLSVPTVTDALISSRSSRAHGVCRPVRSARGMAR